MLIKSRVIIYIVVVMGCVILVPLIRYYISPSSNPSTESMIINDSSSTPRKQLFTSFKEELSFLSDLADYKKLKSTIASALKVYNKKMNKHYRRFLIRTQANYCLKPTKTNLCLHYKELANLPYLSEITNLEVTPFPQSITYDFTYPYLSIHLGTEKQNYSVITEHYLHYAKNYQRIPVGKSWQDPINKVRYYHLEGNWYYEKVPKI